jgi:hypothetical protein
MHKQEGDTDTVKECTGEKERQKERKKRERKNETKKERKRQQQNSVIRRKD